MNFKEILALSCQRWLQQICLDPTSIYYGVADREYWAWKTKDFANGTWQGGIAGLLDSRELIDFSDEECQKIVAATLQGTKFIQRSNGSFEEAYPLESSVAVTSLVTFNWLYVHRKYKNFFTVESELVFQEIVDKAMKFLKKTPESHGAISNHIATVAGCEFLRDRSDAGLQSLIGQQDPEEHWFPEYSGADPGYQSLLNHYFAACQNVDSSSAPLNDSLKSSNEFCAHFAFSSGAYAGEIGSRGTGIYYPSGQSQSLGSWFLNQHLAQSEHVNPLVVDSGNFVPLFNSWALFHQMYSGNDSAIEKKETKTHFKNAGLFVARSANAELAVSLKNACVRKWRKKDGRWEDQSHVGYTGPQTSTQLGLVESADVQEQSIELQGSFGQRQERKNTLLTAIALRLLAVLTYFMPPLQRALKFVLARFVMSSQQGGSQKYNLKINLSDESLPVNWSVTESQTQPQAYGFHRHMASANAFERRALRK